MTKDKTESDQLAELRKKAEAKLSAQAPKPSDLTREQIHEIQSYQIELEMQNEAVHSIDAARSESTPGHVLIMDDD